MAITSVTRTHESVLMLRRCPLSTVSYFHHAEPSRPSCALTSGTRDEGNRMYTGWLPSNGACYTPVESLPVCSTRRLASSKCSLHPPCVHSSCCMTKGSLAPCVLLHLVCFDVIACRWVGQDVIVAASMVRGA